MALVLAVTGGAFSQAETPGLQDRRVGRSSVLRFNSFSGCGTIREGKDFCLLVFRSDGVDYRLDNYGDFLPGATVTVTGVLDPGCDPGCVEPEACIRENTITADCNPTQLLPSTWGSVKARYR